MATDNNTTSLKTRILIFSGAALLLVIALFVSAQWMVRETARQSIGQQQELRVFGQHINQIQTQLQKVERSIFLQAIDPDTHTVDNAEQGVLSLQQQIRELQDKVDAAQARLDAEPRSNARDYSPLIRSIHQLHNQLIVLSDQLSVFSRVNEDIRLRYPGMILLEETLLPLNREFIKESSLAIEESEEPGIHDAMRDQARLKFQELRYAWAQQISWGRLFVANRSGIFGDSDKSMALNLKNRAVYLAQVKKLVKELDALDAQGGLGLQQSESLENIKNIVSRYQASFKKARDIYLSDEWRQDLQILQGGLKPVFERVWEHIFDINNQLIRYSELGIRNAQNTASKISAFIWVVGIVFLLSLVLVFLIFEYLIRRPIFQVVDALDAEARGEKVQMKFNARVKETVSLIRAFEAMHQQIHSRQTRLEAILDNAAEGIITIDDRGRIETFNTAAQELFGYQADEIIGQNVSILVPSPHQKEHDRYLREYIDHQRHNIIGIAREVSAVRKDGRVFPMSLKVSEMFLEGKRYFTAVVENIAERQAMLQNLQRLAEHDSLTGLFNRHYFMEELERRVQEAARGNSDTALLYIDLDNFKYINDSLGHLAGDQLIVEIASLLRDETRGSDVIGRIGGDEFGVLVRHTDPDKLFAVAERFRQAIDDFDFKFDGKSFDSSCSIGATFFDSTVSEKEQVLARADFACHEAKRTGRNCVHVYSSDDESRMMVLSSDMSWTRIIKEALADDRFVLAYQPIVKLPQQEITRYEILVRMFDESGELIMPGGFLPAAERFGLMTRIDEWVIEHALHQLALLNKQNPNIGFSINLSGSSVEDARILAVIKRALEEFGVAANNIIFEVTESVAMASLKNAAQMLDELRQLGCRTALDDFGIGYSSFAYLKDLPVDFVKIDGSFVRDLKDSTLSQAFVRSINDVAHEMGKFTIAEFVEDRESVKLLAMIGVDHAQGFYFGKPVLETDFEINGLLPPRAGTGD